MPNRIVLNAPVVTAENVDKYLPSAFASLSDSRRRPLPFGWRAPLSLSKREAGTCPHFASQ